MTHPNIYAFVKAEESKFETNEIRLGENWTWNFKYHVGLLTHLKNGVFFTGTNDYLRAFKNIMEPILNLAYWTEDIEVKDITFFIEGGKGRALSFLIKKYHDEVYVRENNLDTFIDEITESDIDYGGVLVQKTDKGRPEVIDFNSIAFCDQTDILGGPIAFKFSMNPDKLREMSKFGWGEEKNGATISISDLITIAKNTKDPVGIVGSSKNETTGKNIEVYVLRGCLPEHYMMDNDNVDNYYNQVQVIAFYTDKNHKKEGVTLYRKPEEESQLKFHTSKKVYGRALGRGVGESLIHPQIWTNFLTIHKTRMLESASKVPLYTDDPNYQNRNKIQDMENLEITTIEEGKVIRQVPTAATANIQLYENSINEWFEHAQFTGSAFDPVLGKDPSSGTTFRGQERTVAQGRGPHDRRRGQRAKFIEEIYRDWIIPDIVKKIVKGKKFLASFTSEEMTWVTDQLADNFAHTEQLDSMPDLKMPKGTEVLRQDFSRSFSKRGNKHSLEIKPDEFRGLSSTIGINVTSKQKDLVNLSDKILSIFQFIFANPQAFQQAMQIPALAKAFQDLLEFGGMNQADFASLVSSPIPSPVQPQTPQPLELPQVVA
ncbi:MAG: hypothetical protein Q6360_13260 [Candidatus Brocadiales bacterium]|nr:hypothetical protein [Candidatus Brocadiales bacterium]